MSLYEASAHLFYGVRIQRTGCCADDNPPLDLDKVCSYSIQVYLEERGHTFPDWHTVFQQVQTERGCPAVIRSIHDLPPDHEVHKLLKEHRDALRAASFGCKFMEMGSGEQDDHVLYAVVSNSEFSCCSEDDHGGFGEEIIPAERLAKGADWDELLAKFCAYVGVPAELVKPRWTLSMKG